MEKIIYCKKCNKEEEHIYVSFTKKQGYVWYCPICGTTTVDKKLRRKDWIRNYQREYHRTDKMKEYMKNYHADPENNAKAKARRETPEGKKAYKISKKKWENSEKGKAYYKKYFEEHKERCYANNKRARQKRKLNKQKEVK